MSPVLAAVLAVLGTLLVLTALYAGVKKHQARMLVRPDTLHGLAEETTVKVEDQEARALDPENPPKWMTWKGVDGRINCTCHTLPIRTGDRVLTWPIPNHPQGGMDLFCERTVQEARGG